MKSDFRDLQLWKKGKELRMYVFTLIKKFPAEEKFRLSDQMIRSSRSFTANIAEGYGRFHYQDNIRFCNNARGSAYELIDHIEVALECSYIDNNEYSQLIEKSEEIIALDNGYIKYLRNRKIDASTKKSI